MKNNIKNKIVLIDGYGFVFRAFFSLPPLRNPDGVPVSAVYGFMNMIIKLLGAMEEVSHMAVVFDAGGKTFRNDLYSEYKANRAPCPEDLKPQFPLIREAAEALGLEVLEKVGYEADDLIASAAKEAKELGLDVLVVSSDKDLMQIVNDKVSLYDAMKEKMIGYDEVMEKFGVTPDKVIDVQSLIGDSSDNVPGVPGIGPKTASKLINEYGNLENLLADIDSSNSKLDGLISKKIKQSLSNNVAIARLSRELVYLKDDVDFGVKLDDLKIKSVNADKLLSFLDIHGFKRLKERVAKEFGNGSSDNWNIKKIETDNDLKEVINLIKKEKKVAIDLSDEELALGIGLNIFITALDDKTDRDGDLITDILEKDSSHMDKKSMDIKLVISGLKEVFEDDSILKIGYHIKKIFHFLDQFEVCLNGFDDVKVMSHLLNAGREEGN